MLLSACDTPFFKHLLEAMIPGLAGEARTAVVCRSSRGLEPLPGVFSCRLLQRLQAQVQSDDLRLRTLLNPAGPEYCLRKKLIPRTRTNYLFLTLIPLRMRPEPQKWPSFLLMIRQALQMGNSGSDTTR